MHLRGKQSSSAPDPGAVPLRRPICPTSVRRSVRNSAFGDDWSWVIVLSVSVMLESADPRTLVASCQQFIEPGSGRKTLTTNLVIVLSLGGRLALRGRLALVAGSARRPEVRVRGLMVPLQVVLTAERPLAPRLKTGKIAFPGVDVLEVDPEVKGPCEGCENLSLTLVNDDSAHIPASHPWYGQKYHFVVSCVARFFFGSDASPTPESGTKPPSLRSGERSGTWTMGSSSSFWDEPSG